MDIFNINHNNNLDALFPDFHEAELNDNLLGGESLHNDSKYKTIILRILLRKIWTFLRCSSSTWLLKGELGFNPPALDLKNTFSHKRNVDWRDCEPSSLVHVFCLPDRGWIWWRTGLLPVSKSLLKLSLYVEFHIFKMSAIQLLTSQNEFDFMLIKWEAAAYKAAAF